MSMSAHSDSILLQYDHYLPAYQTIATFVKETLQSFVKEAGLLVSKVSVRVKTRESLAGKLALKGDKYADIKSITDIVGGRIVVFFSDHIEKFAAKVESTFDIDWDNSVDKGKLLHVDQFGYTSLHYICSIPEHLYKDEGHPEINQFKFEIQLRTTLQDAWANIAHDTGYKSDVEVPAEYLRGLNRLAGLLELADENFCQIRDSINQYRFRVKQLVRDGDLSAIELNIDAFEAYLENGGFRKLNERIASINNMEIEEISLRNFLPIFKNLGLQTIKDLDDLYKKYSDVAYRFAFREFDGKDVDIITSATAPMTLCVVYVLSMGMGEPVVKMLLDAALGERKSNARRAHRLAQIGQHMGLTKNDTGDDDGE